MLFHNVSLATNPQVTFKNSRCPTVGIFAAVLWEIMKVELSSTKKNISHSYRAKSPLLYFHSNKKGSVKTAVYRLKLKYLLLCKVFRFYT